MILFVNACVRKDSRTKQLAKHLLSYLEGDVKEVRPAELSFPAVDEAFLSFRDRCIRERDFSDPIFSLAKDFSAADRIVIAAPFWDLSFPAALKQYFEQINVLGITFVYTPEGIPAGLCKARCLTYVTTAGGSFVPKEFGPGYVRALARNFYGIPEFKLIQAAGLDLDGADIAGILASAKADITR